jgi:hypothetical protein
MRSRTQKLTASLLLALFWAGPLAVGVLFFVATESSPAWSIALVLSLYALEAVVWSIRK